MPRGRILKWSFTLTRALLYARNGEYVHGLLTAVPSEAPGLLFTSVPTMSYSTCVFTRTDSQWQYQSPNSLQELRLGYIQDYSYGPFMDEYINSYIGSDRLMVIASMGGIKQLSRILNAKRVGGFISDPLVALNELKYSDLDLKVSACFEQQPFFLALNPEFLWAAKLVKLLNEAFDQQGNKQVLSGLIEEYVGAAGELPDSVLGGDK